MAELPTDIIIKILSKLPVKSLLRFQCVSKEWQSMIRNPKFIKTHLNQTLISNSDRHLLVSVNHSSFHSSELNNNLSFSFSDLRHPLNPCPQPFILLGSCNGVVCTSNLSKTDVVLFNPLTNSHRKLPSTNYPASSLNKTVFGFGYDSENEDYKVLRIVQGLGTIDDSTNKAEVYNLRTNSWKCIKGIPYYLYYGYFDGVLVNEGLHYVVTDEVNSECLSIAKFDLRTDTFSLMHCPNDGKFENYSESTVFILTELGGCLCLLINYYTPGAIYEILPLDEFDMNEEFDARVLDQVELWVMREYGNESSWVRLFSFREPEDIGGYKYIRTLVYSKDGGRLLLEIDGSWYCWYDLKSKTVERVTAHGLPIGDFKTGTFIGSIVLLEDKLQSGKETLPKMTKKKKDVDRFLSTGFKLRL